MARTHETGLLLIAILACLMIGFSIGSSGPVDHVGLSGIAERRGERLFADLGCGICHRTRRVGTDTEFDLSGVMERRSDSFVRAVLRDPESVLPGQRRMPRYELTDGQIDDLIAFLAIRAGGSVDWSDRPDHASPEPVTRPASFDRHCAGCHSLEGRGGVGGPALDGVGSRLTPDFIARWLRDPREIDPDSRMPQPVLTDAERAELESFLVGLKNGRTR